MPTMASRGQVTPKQISRTVGFIRLGAKLLFCRSRRQFIGGDVQKVSSLWKGVDFLE